MMFQKFEPYFDDRELHIKYCNFTVNTEKIQIFNFLEHLETGTHSVSIHVRKAL